MLFLAFVLAESIGGKGEAQRRPHDARYGKLMRRLLLDGHRAAKNITIDTRLPGQRLTEYGSFDSCWQGLASTSAQAACCVAYDDSRPKSSEEKCRPWGAQARCARDAHQLNDGCVQYCIAFHHRHSAPGWCDYVLADASRAFRICQDSYPLHACSGYRPEPKPRAIQDGTFTADGDLVYSSTALLPGSSVPTALIDGNATVSPGGGASGNSSLSAGVIAAIAIAAVLVIALIIIIVVCCSKKKEGSSSSSSSSSGELDASG
jgi:hypothetical protein